MTAVPAGLFPLRPYQREIVGGLARAVEEGGGACTVMLPRQSGKNECSVRLEVLVLTRGLEAQSSRVAVKCAPIGNQVNISARRLEERLAQCGLGEVTRRVDGYKVRVGFTGVDFLSAEPTADNAGHTASLMLEADEAQDIDTETFDKTFAPMAASTNATRIYYGTPWADDSLLERQKRENLELEKRDGIRRHFEVSWERVADEEPTGAYRRYVEGERDRLGEDHPLFATQYGMRTIAGTGRLFKPVDRALMLGRHSRLSSPVAGELYVAGLDVGGSAVVATQPDALASHDSTILSIGRVSRVAGVAGEPADRLELVEQYAWTGAPTTEMYGGVLQLLRLWRCVRVVGDATGLGEPLAEFLLRQLGARVFTPWKFTTASKSHLGYGLLGRVKTGRFVVWMADSSPEYVDLIHQVEMATVDYLPSLQMRWSVPEADGHDDRLVSVALMSEAAVGAAPRVARGVR